MSELHPSQVHLYLQMYQKSKITSYLCFVASVFTLAIAVDVEQKTLKPWLLAGTVAAVAGGSRSRQTQLEMSKTLGDIETISKLNYQAWVKQKTLPTAQLAVTVGSFDADWKPDNLITDPVEYIQKKQKHVALIGGTGDGKSTFTQYLSSKIGGRVIVYDSDAKPDDWSWINPADVIGRKGNFTAINKGMGHDLEILEELVQLRGESGNSAIAGRERFMIAEEFPILVDECDNAATWLKKHAKRGRRYQQFILAIAQNDTAENFGLAGDKDTLYSCFCLVRLGQFGHEQARKLKNPQLEQWLKAGGKRRFMVDDFPCELDLSNWGITLAALPQATNGEEYPVIELNEFEEFILNWGKEHPGEILKARILLQSSRLFSGMQPDEVRIILAALADKGFGQVEGTGDRLGWKWSA